MLGAMLSLWLTFLHQILFDSVEVNLQLNAITLHTLVGVYHHYVTNDSCQTSSFSGRLYMHVIIKRL